MLGRLTSKRVKDAALEDLETVQKLLMSVDNILDHNADGEDAMHTDIVKARNSVQRLQRKIRKYQVDSE